MSFAPRTFTTGMRCVPHEENRMPARSGIEREQRMGPPGHILERGPAHRVPSLENCVFQKGEIQLTRLKFSEIEQHSTWRGGIKSLQRAGVRTASGIRTQHHEIKYKKPTVHCGNTRRRRGRERRWHSQGGGGHQISTTFWGRYRMGLTHRFFIQLGGLNYFLEIKEFKRPCASRNQCPKQLQGVRRPRVGSSPVRRSPRRIYFSGPTRGGGSNLWGTRARDRSPYFSPRNWQNLFFRTHVRITRDGTFAVRFRPRPRLLSVRKNAAKFKVGGVVMDRLTDRAERSP